MRKPLVIVAVAAVFVVLFIVAPVVGAVMLGTLIGSLLWARFGPSQEGS